METTTCEVADSVQAYECQTEEQCDDCFMVDHLKECEWCQHHDHPPRKLEVQHLASDYPTDAPSVDDLLVHLGKQSGFSLEGGEEGDRTAQDNERLAAPGPYLISEHALDECMRQFMAKPASARHLYEIYTTPQPPLVGAVLSQEIVAELARLRDFL